MVLLEHVECSSREVTNNFNTNLETPEVNKKGPEESVASQSAIMIETERSEESIVNDELPLESGTLFKNDLIF